MSPVQNLLIFLLMFFHIQAKKPPGYVEPPKEYDPNPPKYEYGYRILDEKGEQGKDEQRDGIFAKGRYYVQDKESSQNVEYIADDWGYHPVVEYSSAGPHSRSRTNFAIGEESLKQLKNKENGQPTILDNSNQQSTASPENQQPHHFNNDKENPTPTASVSTDPSKESTATQPTTHVNQPQDVERPHQQLILIPPQDSLTLALQHEIQPTDQPAAVKPQAHSKPEQNLVEQQPQNVVLEQNNHEPNEGVEQSSVQYIYQHDDDQAQGQDIFFLQHHGSPVLLENGQTVFQPQTLVAGSKDENQTQESVFFTQNENGQQLVFSQEGLILGQEGIGSFQKQEIIQQQPNNLDQQLVLQQEQNYPLNYQDQKVLYHTNIVHSQEHAGAQENNNVKASESPVENYKEFGAKLNVETPNNLIESTKNLISGQDVLNLNEAVLKEEHSHNQIESSTASVAINPSTKLYSTSTSIPNVSEASLAKEPIIAAEINEKTTSQEATLSTTLYEDKSVIVTPRPVSTKFLAPITAGIQLVQNNIEPKTEEAQQQVQYAPNQNVVVEIQQSLPYYLGKYEYPSGYAAEYNEASVNNIESQVKQDLALGKTLLLLPTGAAEPLVSSQPKNNIEINQQQSSSNVIAQEEEKVHIQPSLIQQENVSEETEKTKIVETPQQYQYPVELQYQLRQHLTQYVEKPIFVPQPYPVETVVEKHVHVPYEVTKYVDKPYPVEVPVPYPVDRVIEKQVHVPYPVEKIVEKIVNQPYPVEVRVPYPQPIETIVEKQVPVPYEVEKLVEKLVKEPYPIPYRVPYPYPHPVPVEKKVPIPYYVDRPVQYSNVPYPVEVKVPSPNIKVVNVEVPKYISKPKYTSAYLGQYQGASKIKEQKVVGNPYAYAPNVNYYLPPRQEMKFNSRGRVPWKMQFFNANHIIKGNGHKNLNNEYLPPVRNDQQENLVSSSKNKDHHVASDSNHQNSYFPIKNDDLIGLSPPKYRNNVDDNGYKRSQQQNFRSARSSFDEKSVRMEYGFMPPLVPSLEIDEQGRPIEKDKR